VWHNKPRHAERRQQVGAPHDIGDHSVSKRMQSQIAASAKAGAASPRTVTPGRTPGATLNFVQREIDPVIASGRGPFAQNA